MASSNGNLFRVTGHLCGEFTGLRWISRTKASNSDVFFKLRLNKRFSKQSWSWWFETSSSPFWRHYNAMPPSPNGVHIHHTLLCISRNCQQWLTVCSVSNTLGRSIIDNSLSSCVIPIDKQIIHQSGYTVAFRLYRKVTLCLCAVAKNQVKFAWYLKYNLVLPGQMVLILFILAGEEKDPSWYLWYAPTAPYHHGGCRCSGAN